MVETLTPKLNIVLNVELNPAIAAISSISDRAWQDWFQIWLNLLTSKIEMTSTDYEVSLLIVGDEAIQALNAQYRHQDCPTDVLAFASLEVEIPSLDIEDLDSEIVYLDENIHESVYFEEPVYLGDIIISATTAARQALEQGHSTNRELAWLAAHGLLHLLGWDHPDDRSLEEMLTEQELLVQAIAIPVPAEKP